MDNDPEIGFSIEKRLSDSISNDNRGRNISDQLYRHGERIVSGPGKRIRMWAGYNAAKAFDPDLDYETIIDSMIPVEVVHGFSLLIDDVDDGDKTRRGMPTLHEFALNGLQGVREKDELDDQIVKDLEEDIPEIYHNGLVDSSKRAESMAVNYGIFLRNEAYEWISNAENIPDDKRLAIADLLRNEERKLPRGQIYDLESEELLTNTEGKKLASRVGEDFDFDGFYDDVISLKTAPLFIAPVRIAGEIADAEQSKVDDLAEAIEYTAKAFQIRDDVIDITQGEIGKDRYSDIREGTLNKPIFNSLEFFKNNSDAENVTEDYVESNGYLPEAMIDSYGSASEFMEHVISDDYVHDKEVEIAGELVQQTDAVEKSNKLAKDYAERAEEIYDSLEVEDRGYLGSLNNMNWLAATRSK